VHRLSNEEMLKFTTRCLYAILTLFFSHQSVRAQHQQLWFDHQIDYPFANSFLFEMTTSYQTLLSDEDKWRSFNISPSLEYRLFVALDLQAAISFAYTVQKSNYNSFESCPYVGAIVHITQNKRINTRLNLRLEERLFKNLEDDVWDNSTRLRIKAEGTISINGPNLYKDKLWYAIIDYEEFIVMDEQLDERFANRRRGRLGVGYRLSYRDRFELIYTLQSSRNEIDGDFIRNDNILQLKYKMYFNPSPALSR